MSLNNAGQMTQAELSAHCLQNPLNTASLRTAVSGRKKEGVPKANEVGATSSKAASAKSPPVYDESDSEKHDPSFKIHHMPPKLAKNAEMKSRFDTALKSVRELENIHGWKTYRGVKDESLKIVVVPRGNAPFKRHQAIEVKC